MGRKTIKKRDPNYICGICYGDLVKIDKLENSQRVYACNSCGSPNTSILECTVCHLPKTIWADSGTICADCFFKWQSGKIKLSRLQIEGIKEWIVTAEIVYVKKEIAEPEKEPPVH